VRKSALLNEVSVYFSNFIAVYKATFPTLRGTKSILYNRWVIPALRSALIWSAMYRVSRGNDRTM